MIGKQFMVRRILRMTNFSSENLDAPPGNLTPKHIREYKDHVLGVLCPVFIDFEKSEFWTAAICIYSVSPVIDLLATIGSVLIRDPVGSFKWNCSLNLDGYHEFVYLSHRFELMGLGISTVI